MEYAEILYFFADFRAPLRNVEICQKMRFN